jgi:hypothetical protein
MKYSILFAFFVFFLVVLIILYIKYNMNKEGFNTPLIDYETAYPLQWNIKNYSQNKDIQSNFLLSDSFPIKTQNQVNFTNENRKWWHKPVFKEGSYQQITNNLKYFNNPDIANSTPEEFSGAFYSNHQYSTNIILPLSPVPVETNKIRIGWWNSSDNMLPFVANGPNIIY